MDDDTATPERKQQMTPSPLPAPHCLNRQLLRPTIPSQEHGGSRAPPQLLQLLGPSLVQLDGTEVPTSKFIGPNKVIGLYFSADWCPPCHRVTPHLAAIYRSFKSQHPRAPDWEVLFVSSDRDEAAFRQHHATMPWPALPFRDRAAKDALSRLCKVRGLPSLVLVDGETGDIITNEGRAVVFADEQCLEFPWKPAQMEDSTLCEHPRLAAAYMSHRSGDSRVSCGSRRARGMSNSLAQPPEADAAACRGAPAHLHRSTSLRRHEGGDIIATVGAHSRGVAVARSRAGGVSTEAVEPGCCRVRTLSDESSSGPAYVRTGSGRRRHGYGGRCGGYRGSCLRDLAVWLGGMCRRR